MHDLVERAAQLLVVLCAAGFVCLTVPPLFGWIDTRSVDYAKAVLWSPVVVAILTLTVLVPVVFVAVVCGRHRPPKLPDSDDDHAW